MVESVLWYGCWTLAVLIAGIAKGGFGGGGAFVSTLLVAIVMPPHDAVAVMLLIFVMMDQVSMVLYWKKWNFRVTWPLLWSCVVGVVVGWLVFDFVDESMIKILMALMVVVFFVSLVWKAGVGKGVGKGKGVMKKKGLWRVLGGATAGFSSCIANAGGPPVTMVLLSEGLKKTTFQGSAVLFFWWVNAVKLPFFWELGLFTWENVKLSLAMLPLTILGLVLGFVSHRRISEVWYKRIIYALLVGVSVKLVYDGVTGLA